MERVKVDGVCVGKLCGTVLLEGEDVCPDHKNKDSCSLDLYEYTCKFIISQAQGKNRERSKKGLECGLICKEGNQYCKNHLKSENHVLIDKDIAGYLEFKDENNNVEHRSALYKNNKTITHVIRCFKVRAYPTKEQREIYNKFSGDCRKTFNLLVEKQKELKGKTNHELRTNFVTSKSLIDQGLEYLTKTPKDCRDFAITEFTIGIKEAFEKYEDKKQKQEEYRVQCQEQKRKYVPKKIKSPRMNFRKKKDNQSVNIPKTTVTLNQLSVGIFPRFFNKQTIRLQGRVKKDKKYNDVLKNGIKHDIKFIKTRTGKFYFSIPYDVQIKETPKLYDFGSGDPGVKTFLSTYNINGESRKFGEECDIKIRKVHKKLNYLRSLIPFYTHLNLNTELKQLKGTILRIEEHLKNKVKDLHFKVIKYIITHKKFYLPKFNSKQMVENKTTYKCTKREMNQLSHYQFSQKLKSKAEEVVCNVSISDEFRTTMVCDKCLRKNYTVGTSRTFECEHCSWTYDRDEHSARANVLKYLQTIE